MQKDVLNFKLYILQYCLIKLKSYIILSGIIGSANTLDTAFVTSHVMITTTMMCLKFYYHIVCTVQKETAKCYDATHM